MVVRKISEDEKKDALELVLKVFLEYEAPDYSSDGVESFKRTVIYNEDYTAGITMFGAFENDIIAGVAATRKNGSHIALFFVDSQYQRKGIGKLLFQTILEQSTEDEITVNSSPYAVQFYHHLGFLDTALEQEEDGIRYIPMRYQKKLSDIASLTAMLLDKDTAAAYKALQELEKISDKTGLVYAYTEKFISMISSDKYVERVRGFRLFCKQAKWDTDYLLDENMDDALHILQDEKPTAVRQALAAISDIVRYKPDLRETIEKAVTHINYLRYKDTMHSLIEKDIQDVLLMIKEAGTAPDSSLD